MWNDSCSRAKLVTAKPLKPKPVVLSPLILSPLCRRDYSGYTENGRGMLVLSHDNLTTLSGGLFFSPSIHHLQQLTKQNCPPSVPSKLHNNTKLQKIAAPHGCLNVASSSGAYATHFRISHCIPSPSISSFSSLSFWKFNTGALHFNRRIWNSTRMDWIGHLAPNWHKQLEAMGRQGPNYPHE